MWNSSGACVGIRTHIHIYILFYTRTFLFTQQCMCIQMWIHEHSHTKDDLFQIKCSNFHKWWPVSVADLTFSIFGEFSIYKCHICAYDVFLRWNGATRLRKKLKIATQEGTIMVTVLRDEKSYGLVNVYPSGNNSEFWPLFPNTQSDYTSSSISYHGMPSMKMSVHSQMHAAIRPAHNSSRHTFHACPNAVPSHHWIFACLVFWKTSC